MKLNSIWLPAILHCLIDGMGALFTNPTAASQTEARILSWPDVFVSSIIILILTIPFFVLCHRMKENSSDRQNYANKSKFSQNFYIISKKICLKSLTNMLRC